MEVARSVLEVPTPRVFPWSADANNPVRSEYIIMQEAPGKKLEDIWEKKMISISFNRSANNTTRPMSHRQRRPRSGNLYYASEAIQAPQPSVRAGRSRPTPFDSIGVLI
ncbi:hypothetical protein BJX63DRAFT_396885 [Aspergillus granulosus]|uniref:Uncharacterized protein n=1 Tax=Aspergillus granulosus TaxID=176169 RepID=A0ABR4HAC4_9EURO